MSMEIVRNEDRCNLCWRCVKDCAAGVWRDIEGIPTPFAPDMCNLCSHCIAVCPKDAIEHSGLDKSQLHKVDKKLISPESFRETVLARRSIREYKKKAIPKDVLEDLIAVARYSPTASNTQNVSYTVVTDEELLKKISRRIFGFGERINRLLKKPAGKVILKGISRTNMGQTVGRYSNALDYYKSRVAEGKDYILHHAPALIVLHAPKNASFACDNCNIAATNITNYAHALGLGTCYIGFLTMSLRYDSAMNKWLKIPKSNRAFASFVVGYPVYTHTYTVSRKEPAVTWI